METFNIAIIGFGGMGEYHSERIKNLDGFNIAGIYDINAERSEYAALKNFKIFSSREEVAAAKDVAAVIIASPNDSHRELSEFYLSHRKNVLVEKPAAVTCKDYRAISAAAVKNKVILSVNQNRRCDEDFLTVKQIIDNRLVGDVYRIESRVMGANGIPGDWRKLIKHGGGMLLDWGVHMVDQICLLTQSGINTLYCNFSYFLGYEVDDGFDLRLDFDEGLTAQVVVDSNCFVNLPRWAIYGSSGTAQIYGFEHSGKIIVNYDASQKPEAQARGNGLTKTMAARPSGSVREIELPAIKKDNDLIYNNFRDACLNGAKQIVEHNQVERVLKVLETAQQSAFEKAVLKVRI